MKRGSYTLYIYGSNFNKFTRIDILGIDSEQKWLQIENLQDCITDSIKNLKLSVQLKEGIFPQIVFPHFIAGSVENANYRSEPFLIKVNHPCDIYGDVAASRRANCANKIKF